MGRSGTAVNRPIRRPAGQQPATCGGRGRRGRHGGKGRRARVSCRCRALLLRSRRRRLGLMAQVGCIVTPGLAGPPPATFTPARIRSLGISDVTERDVKPLANRLRASALVRRGRQGRTNWAFWASLARCSVQSARLQLSIRRASEKRWMYLALDTFDGVEPLATGEPVCALDGCAEGSPARPDKGRWL